MYMDLVEDGAKSTPSVLGRDWRLFFHDVDIWEFAYPLKHMEHIT